MTVVIARDCDVCGVASYGVVDVAPSQSSLEGVTYALCNSHWLAMHQAVDSWITRMVHAREHEAKGQRTLSEQEALK